MMGGYHLHIICIISSTKPKDCLRNLQVNKRLLWLLVTVLGQGICDCDCSTKNENLIFPFLGTFPLQF